MSQMPLKTGVGGTANVGESTSSRSDKMDQSGRAKFEIWDASDPVQRGAWMDLWQNWPDREASSHPDYGKLFSGTADRVLCASYVTPDNGSVLYSFILREIPHSIHFHSKNAPLTDIITPYGYGGPHIWNVSQPGRLSVEFWHKFDIWARSANVISEFIRFGLFPGSFLHYPGNRITRSSNIIRSLDMEDGALFMSFEQKVRKNVRKAERSGLRVIVDESGVYLSDFLRLYHGTMDRRAASTGYYFPQSFFESIHQNLTGHFTYFHALRNDVIVSTELVLVSESRVYSFLGGTEESAFEFRPNDLLKYEIIRWSRDKGKKSFILGGGASPGDGIERYKRSFAPHGEVQFYTGQRIFQPDIYDRLVRSRQADLALQGRTWSDDPSFFPAYRMPL